MTQSSNVHNFQNALSNNCTDGKGIIMSYAVNTHAGITNSHKQNNLDRVAIIQSS